MLVLGLDTATAQVTAALVELLPGEPPRWGASVERSAVDPQRHGELLAGLIADCFAELGATRSELSAVAVGLGPGPFTGLRVGIVTAAALSDALGVPAYGSCSLDAVAAADEGEPAARLVVTDARRREVYWAEYDENDQRVAGPVVMAPAELAQALAETGWTGRVLGDGAHRYDLGLPVADGPRYPSAGAHVLLAARRVLQGAPADPLTPLYLRRPDAVPPGAAKRVT